MRQPKVKPLVEPAVVSPEEALQRLTEGNQRYINHQSIYPNQTEARRAELANAQQPFAIILGCVDSRVAPEFIFDCGLGDLFVIRTAGQVIDTAVMGSAEFGAAQLGIPLILVLGHDRCGAVIATIEALTKPTQAPGSIHALLEAIRPAVESVHHQPGDLVDNAIRANVELGVSRLKASPILAGLLAEGKLKIVGGRYDLDTGVVEFTIP
jgi:carbonic anhydrase